MSKILLNFISGIKGGGVEQYLQNNTPAIKRAGITSYVVYQHMPNAKSLDALEHSGCICIRIPEKKNHPLKNVIESVKIIKKLHPDIVECHEDLANVFPLIASRIAGSKIRIAHIHSNGSDFKAPRIMIKYMKKAICLLSTDYIACSINAGRYIFANRKFEVIPNGIEVERFKFSIAERNLLRKKYNLEGNILMGSIGRLTLVKNHLRMFEILKEAKLVNEHVKLVIIGNGELEIKLKEQISTMGLEDDVLFLGFLRNVHYFYSMIDILLIPSFYEGGPITSIEAQASGLPVLMSTTVNQDLKILPTTKTESLSLSAVEWCKIVLHLCQMKNNRSYANIVMKRTEYNLDNSIPKLISYYLDLLKRG